MVKVLILLLSLLAGPALAQGSLVTPAVSPWNVIDVQGTSPWAVNGGVTVNGTVTVSPTGNVPVNCVSGCSAAASPSTVIISSSVTAPVITSPIAGVYPVTQASSPWGINGAVTVNGTATVSLTAGLPTLTVSPVAGTYVVSPGTSPWTVTLNASPSNVAVVNTVTTSPVAGNYPVTVTNTPTVSLTNATTVTASLSAGLPTITTSPVAGTYIVSPSTSPWAMTIATSPVGVQELNGSAYPNHSNWVAGSISTATTGNQVLLKAPTANKLYITGISCGRNDTVASGSLITLDTSPITLGFNTTLGNGTSFYIVVPGINGGSQVNLTFPTPLQVAATTSLQFTQNISVASLQCNAEGFNAP